MPLKIRLKMVFAKDNLAKR